MRFAISAVFAFATSFTLIAAQDLSGIPSCAIPCFAAALPSSGCGITDVTCQCTTGRAAIQDALMTCTPKRCSADDVAIIANAVVDTCAKSGITITDIPTAIPSATASGSASATASGSASASASNKASVSSSASATGSGAVATSTGAAGMNVVAWGAVAMGVAAGVLGA